MHLCAQVCFQRGERDGPDSPGGKASIQQTPPCAISAHLLLFPAGGKIDPQSLRSDLGSIWGQSWCQSSPLLEAECYQ